MISSRTRFLIEKIRDRFFFKKKGTVLVVCWSMSHNPLGRAFLFTDFLRRNYRVKIIGPIFPKFSKKIWKPLRKYLRGADAFTVSNFPDFFEDAMQFAAKQKAFDVVIICKPRLPSILIGLLVAQKNNAKIILDIDDFELAFFDNHQPLELNEAIKQGLDLSNPFNETWTRICNSWIKDFPNRMVSNHKLKEKFGGTIIPHVRNERIFNPRLYNRAKIRRGHGYTDKDKVILFLGTPREHKGFEEIPKALKEIGNPHYKFCLIGKIRNNALRERFHKEYAEFVQIFQDSDFRDLPKKLCIADLVCLLQDENSLVSEYQLPAKFIDAIAMEVPVLAAPVGPLLKFAEEKFLIPLTPSKSLGESIHEIFGDMGAHRKAAENIRSLYFDSQFSFKAGSDRINMNELLKMGPTTMTDILTDIESAWNKK